MRTKNEQLQSERKNKILESALHLFCEKGYNQTSMNDIVKHSGISKGGIYYYFETKEEIFCALGDNILTNRKKILEKFPETISAEEKFRKFIINILTKYQNKDYQKDIKFGFEFWNSKKNENMISGISKKEYLDDRFNKASEELIEIIEDGQKEGLFKSDINIYDFLFALHASIDGTAFFVSLLDRELSNNRIFILADIFCEYLLERK